MQQTLQLGGYKKKYKRERNRFNGLPKKAVKLIK